MQGIHLILLIKEQVRHPPQEVKKLWEEMWQELELLYCPLQQVSQQIGDNYNTRWYPALTLQV